MNIIKSELFLSGFLRGGVEGPLHSAMMSRSKKRDSKQELLQHSSHMHALALSHVQTFNVCVVCLHVLCHLGVCMVISSACNSMQALFTSHQGTIGRFQVGQLMWFVVNSSIGPPEWL